MYALGAILYECLTGRLPFDGPADEMLRRKLTEEPAPPSHLVGGLAPALDRACSRALARAPDRRYESMDEFAAALDERPSAPGRPVRGRRRWVGLAAAGIGAVVLAAAGAMFAAGGCKPSPTNPSTTPTQKPVVPSTDPLPVGSRWVGEQSFDPANKAKWKRAEFRVTHRDGDTFRGEAEAREDEGDFVFEVAGWIRGEKVHWDYVREIRVPRPTGSVGTASAVGKLIGDQLDMTYQDRRDTFPAVIKLTRQK